ncbi:MAG: hypothetical protein ACR2LC_10180 [Pyrinomonadaceae bacterium]
MVETTFSPCAKCRQYIAHNVARCPHCGGSTYSPKKSKRNILILILLIPFACAVFGILGSIIRPVKTPPADISVESGNPALFNNKYASVEGRRAFVQTANAMDPSALITNDVAGEYNEIFVSVYEPGATGADRPLDTRTVINLKSVGFTKVRNIMPDGSVKEFPLE